MKELAINEIMSIYKKHSGMRGQVLQALGKVGGDSAVKEIINIAILNQTSA